MSKTWDNTDKIALAASIAAHVVLFALLSIQLARPQAPDLPKPMAVEIIAESDLEATSTSPSDEAPAAMKAMEEGPAEDAPASAAALPEPAPVMPEPVVAPQPQPPKPKAVAKTVERVIPKPTPKPVPAAKPKPVAKAVTPPKPKTVAAPAAKPKAKAAPTPVKKAATAPAKTSTKVATKSAAATKTSPKSGAGTGKGTAIRPSGDLAGLVGAVGKTKTSSKAASAPGKSAAQIKQSITTSIGNQVKAPWNGCKVPGIDVGDLLTVVKFRLSRDGSLDGITSVTTSGQNDSNRTQVTRHQDCAKKAIQVAAPFTGLPPDHYSYWQDYEFRFKKG